MHFYSILLATLTLTVSTALAGSESQQQALTDCLNLCKDDQDSFSCPPDTEKSQLDNVCSSFPHFLHEYDLTFNLLRCRAAGPAAIPSK